MRIRRYLPAIAIAVAAATVPAFAADNAQNFVNKAMVGGMFEIESSQLALRRSKDADIKKFADMMVSDHGKANADLEALAKEEGLRVPAKLDQEHAATLKSLQEAGTQLDAPYLKAQLEGHEATVRMFEQYAEAGDNDALQKFAVKTLPTLHMHLDSVEELASKVSATE